MRINKTFCSHKKNGKIAYTDTEQHTCIVSYLAQKHFFARIQCFEDEPNVCEIDAITFVERKKICNEQLLMRIVNHIWFCFCLKAHEENETTNEKKKNHRVKKVKMTGIRMSGLNSLNRISHQCSKIHTKTNNK